jgi:methyl-accepting chemotaxis protein
MCSTISTGSASMNWFYNLKIRNKILLSNAVFIVMILVLAVQGFTSLQTAGKIFEDFYKHRFVPVRQLNRTMRNILQIRINQLQELRALEDERWDEVRDRIAQSNELKKANSELWKAYAAQIQDEEERKLAEEYHVLFEKNDEMNTRVRQAIEARDVARASKLEDEWLRSYEPMVKAMDKLIEHQQAAGEEMERQEHATENRSTFISIVVLVSALAIAVLISWILTRGVATPVLAAVARIKDIAEGEGDLTRRLEVQSQDEVGELAQWLNKFIEKIQNIVKDIAQNTEELLQAAKKTTESSQSLSAGTEEMSTQSASIASAATQMNQNIQVISSSVEEMSTSVAEVARKTSEAANVAGEADRTALGASHTINELGDSATEIGKVIESIVNIASQTNLLALNASIEAAGAGEAGRGFAVVASEVKELARQSATASEDIKARIHAIQGSTKKAVEAIGNIAGVIAQVNNISSAIASAVEEQAITSREIARNVEQSSQAAADVTRNIAGVSTAAHEGAKEAQSVAGLANDLNRLSDKLSAIVKQFKI